MLLHSKLFVPVGFNFFFPTPFVVKSVERIDGEFKILILNIPPMNPVYAIEPF